MNAILKALLEVVTMVVSASLLLLIKEGIVFLQTKTKSEKVRRALGELGKVIADGVAYTEQTLVTTFKQNDTWTKEAQKECLSACAQYVVTNLTNETTNLLLTNETDVRDWVTAQIEAYIQQQKTKAD